MIKENNAVSMENWEGLAKSYEASMKEIFEESANLQSRVGDFETSIKTYFDELGSLLTDHEQRTAKKLKSHEQAFGDLAEKLQVGNPLLLAS